LVYQWRNNHVCVIPNNCHLWKTYDILSK